MHTTIQRNKGYKLKKIISIMIITASLASYASRGESTGTRGGGDAYSAEFILYATNLLSNLKLEYPFGLRKINLKLFEELIKSATIESSSEPLYIDEIEKDAINIPSEKKIVFNRGRWNAIGSPLKKLALVFHEFLGLMLEEDDHYQISNFFLNQNLQAFIGDPITRTSLGNFVDHNRAYMQEGTVICKLKSYRSIFIELNMNTKLIYLKNTLTEEIQETHRIRILDSLDAGSKLSVNIVTSLLESSNPRIGDGKIQIISSNAMDSSTKGTWTGVTVINKRGRKGGFEGYTSKIKCKSN